MNHNKLGEEYLLLKELGVGGYAKVYKAKNLKYGYIRAIRVLETHVEDEESKIYRNFTRECGVLLRLGNGGHPNIVRLYQPRLLEGRAFVEMDWIDGVDLRQLIERYNGVVPIEETLKMVKDIGSALAFCHHDIYKVCYDRESDNLEDADDGSALITPETEKCLIEKYRVIHNDIHTGNIMRRNDGTYILLDFGLAVDGKDDVVNSSRRQQGAVEFLSAQRLDGETPTTQDDIYGFGCVLYAMLTGRPPFPVQKKGKDIPVSELARLCDAHRKIPPKPIERADVPLWLKEMTMRCLAKNPSDRYADGYNLYQEILKHTEKVSKSSEASPKNDAELVEKNNALVVEKNSLSESLKKLQTELDGKSNSCEHLEEMLGEMTAKADGLNTEKEQLESDNESLRIANNKYRKKLVPSLVFGLLVGAIALVSVLYFTGFIALPGQAIVAEDDLDKVRNDIDSLNTVNFSLRKTIDEMMQSNNANSDQYALLSGEKLKQERQIDSLKNQIDKLHATNRDLTSQIKSSKNTKSQELQKRIAELEKQLQASQKKLANVQAALEKNKDQYDIQKRMNSQLEAQISKLKSENNTLKEKNTELQKWQNHCLANHINKKE